MKQFHGFICSLVLIVVLGLLLSPTNSFAQDDRVQPRKSMERVTVSPGSIDVDDGDTVTIRWGDDDVEIIRILGIDTPETQHISHNLPFDQPFGREAAGFAMGAFALATKVELLRADQMDPYGRTLGYLFLNGKNYSVLIVTARLADETVNHYGDNGFPNEAAEVLAAAEVTGPVPFEPPYQFRQRMREVTDWMRKTGQLPEGE